MNFLLNGYQAALSAVSRILQAVRPDGATGKAAQQALADALATTQDATHVLSGTLRGSHRAVYQGGAKGYLTIAPAVSPRGGLTTVYGPIERARGGDHDFYAPLQGMEGVRILEKAGRVVVEALPR